MASIRDLICIQAAMNPFCHRKQHPNCRQMRVIDCTDHICFLHYCLPKPQLQDEEETRQHCTCTDHHKALVVQASKQENKQKVQRGKTQKKLTWSSCPPSVSSTAWNARWSSTRAWALKPISFRSGYNSRNRTPQIAADRHGFFLIVLSVRNGSSSPSLLPLCAAILGEADSWLTWRGGGPPMTAFLGSGIAPRMESWILLTASFTLSCGSMWYDCCIALHMPPAKHHINDDYNNKRETANLEEFLHIAAASMKNAARRRKKKNKEVLLTAQLDRLWPRRTVLSRRPSSLPSGLLLPIFGSKIAPNPRNEFVQARSFGNGLSHLIA